MPARTPRRTFARPFVVTLAAAPACYTQAPPPSQPPPPHEQAPAPAPAPAPPPEAAPPAPPPRVIANPPRPRPAPADGTKWTIFKNASGCSAAVAVECPKGQPGGPMPTCNPPPPQPYTCPDNVKLDAPITIVASGGECIVQHEPVHCPPRVMCNPPPPQKVPCP